MKISKKILAITAVMAWFLMTGSTNECNGNFSDGDGYYDGDYGVITGLVKESDLKTGIDGAEVSLVGYYQYATTHDGGQFILEKVPLGEHIIRIKHEDYMTKEITNVRISGGETIPLNNIYLKDIYVDNVSAYEKASNISYVLGKPDNRCLSIENGGYAVLDLGSSEEAADGYTFADFYVGFKDASIDTANVLISVSNYETGPFQRCEWNSEGVSLTGTGLSKAQYIKIEYSAGEAEGVTPVEIDYIRVLNYEIY
ncbi:MAG: carboxypeptidase regulatory-like domain-containing protein [Candidatus Coatesbacteria bacterium]|nr:carboxypeptidase regulatory-like domain-containing protein [Candidatus Coatesbacteria bacterium]